MQTTSGSIEEEGEEAVFDEGGWIDDASWDEIAEDEEKVEASAEVCFGEICIFGK